MDRTDIHRRALRAALQITFIAGATGCDGPQRARPEPATSWSAANPNTYATATQLAPTGQPAGAPAQSDRAACHPTQQVTSTPPPPIAAVPTQVATVSPAPAPTPVPVTSDASKACTDAAATSNGPFSPPVAACCDAVLTATEVAFKNGTPYPADYFSCCSFGSSGSWARHRSVCSPWGPPAPPRMRHSHGDTVARSLAASLARWS